MSATLAELPRVTPNFEAITITDTSVVVPSGGDINAAIATAIATNKRRVLLEPGGSYTGTVTLPYHGFDDWMELSVNATMPAITTRIDRTTSLGFTLPVITAPMGQIAIQVAAGARRWRIRGLDITSAPTEGYNSGDGDTHALVATTPDAVATIADLPYQISVAQNLIHGAEETHHGTMNRRAGVTLNATWVEVIGNSLYNLNYGGLRYDIQSQSGGQFAGLGKLRIENNNVWGSTEGLAWGGASAFVATADDQKFPSDITIRRNHIYRPASVFDYQGVANGLEFKLGRRILIEGNIIENVPLQLQNGFGFLFWTANQNGDNPFVQSADCTVRYNWFKNCSGICSTTSTHAPPLDGIRATRLTYQHNVATGQGCSPIPAWRTIELDSTFTDYHFSNNLLINTGGEYWAVFDFAAFTRASFIDNIVGTTFSGSTILFTSGGADDLAWAKMNENADCEWTGNVAYAPGGQSVNGNTTHTDLASFGFADSSVLSNVNVSLSAMLAGIVNTTGKGPNVTNLSALLTGVEISSGDRALYAT